MPLLRTGLLIGVAMLAACVPKREPPPPAPRPQPPAAQPRPQPPASQPPAPAPADWRDRALTPGSWVHSSRGLDSQALFGPATGGAVFVVRCDRARRQVSLGRQGGSSGPMTIRNTASARNLPVSIQADYSWSALPANDRFLDAIVFSRGRFTVETAGQPMLVIPTWPEPARVIEDCRS